MTSTTPRIAEEPYPEYYIGVDLGQVSDYTTVAIVERSVRGTTYHYECLGLMRAALGTSYPAIVERLQAVAISDELRPFRRSLGRDGRERIERSPDPVCVVDATGVGIAVVDMILRSRIAARCVPLTITSGGTPRIDTWGGARGGPPHHYTPKKDLVGCVQALLQGGRLRFVPGLALAGALKQELFEFKVRVTASANEIFGAWREGTHDDLVLAISIACFVAESRPVVAALMSGDSPLAGHRGTAPGIRGWPGWDG